MTPAPCDAVVLRGISTSFDALSPCLRQVAHALLTRPPLECFGASSSASPLDLHVLGTPPAFVLSQDQTLALNPVLNLEVSFKFKTHVRIDCLCFDATRENRISRLSYLFCIVFKDHYSASRAQVTSVYRKARPLSTPFFQAFFRFLSLIPNILVRHSGLFSVFPEQPSCFSGS